MNAVRLLAACLAAFLSLAVQAQGTPVVADWALHATSLLNPQVTAPLLITATPQTLSAGAPPMSIFDYWNSNSPQAQRLHAGTAGWVASPALPARYVQFEVGPKPGHQLQVGGVSFQYGGAGGLPNRMRSEVRYSVNNWSTSTVLHPGLNYPTPGFTTFAASLSIPPIPAGQKFSLRIYPYAVVNQTAGSPLFASHRVVKINGVSTPVSGGGGAPDLSVTKTCTAQGQANQGVLCTITVKNNGSTGSTAPLTLNDLPTAPAGALFTGGGGSLPISCSPGAGPVLPIHCTANTSIPAGGTATALFSFKMPAQGGVLNNCATVTQAVAPGTAPESNLANNTNICTSVTVPPVGGGGAPDLSVTKTCTAQGQANHGVLCTITVKNNGTAASFAPLTLTDTPTGPSTALFTGGGGTLPISCSPGAGPVLPIQCNANAAIPAGGTATALFSFRLPQGGTLNNCATVAQATPAGSTPEANLANNTACTSVVVAP